MTQLKEVKGDLEAQDAKRWPGIPLPDFDPVKKPEHYADTKIECIDYILDKGLDFPLGNAVKYITRAGKKHSNGMSDTEKAIQDLEKAKVYIDFEIAHLKGEK